MGFNVFVSGRGAVSSDELAIERAVQEYDERLLFGFNEDAQQYCIFIKMPSDWDGPSLGTSKVLPILGFDSIPHPEDAVKKLWEADTFRHGEKILDDLNARNDERMRPAREAADDAGGQMAEAFEWGTRKMGAHPTARVFVPDKKAD